MFIQKPPLLSFGRVYGFKIFSDLFKLNVRSDRAGIDRVSDQAVGIVSLGNFTHSLAKPCRINSTVKNN
jgi:hypothetical protein